MNESGVSDDGSSKKTTKKKKVSFKFGLETSDDAHIVKKEPNTTFDPPVSIIKKECLTRAIRIAPIIAPPRLTFFTQKLKNNNANNIDKLNSLTFKSRFAKKDSSEENVSSNEDDQSDADAETSERKRDSDEHNTDSDEESSHSKNDEADDDHAKGVAFQLPKRSSHSSRVIKPNKRFTDDSKSTLNKNGLGKKKGTKPEIDGDSTETTKKEGMWLSEEKNVVLNVLNNEPLFVVFAEEDKGLKLSDHIKNNPFAKINNDDSFGLSIPRYQFASTLQQPSGSLSNTTTANAKKDNLFLPSSTSRKFFYNLLLIFSFKFSTI